MEQAQKEKKGCMDKIIELQTQMSDHGKGLEEMQSKISSLERTVERSEQ